MKIKDPVLPSFKLSSFMTREHSKLEELMQRYHQQREKDPKAAKRSFLEFRRGLKRHIAWEEEVLFPVFEERTGLHLVGPTHVMRTEHRQVQVLLDALKDILSGDRTSSAELEEELFEMRLFRILRSHEEKEEEILYPWFDVSIPEEEKEDLIQKMEGWLTEPPPHVH